MKTLSYKHTAAACYISYITGAVINNLAPLLFATFSQSFGLSLEQLAKIITMNFGIQIIVDFVGAKFADKIGYRPLIIAAQAFAAAGLASLGTLPRLLDNAYLGIIISAALYAVGSGLMEVLISPIIEALPGDAKASSMSLLHSFYCWGQVLMVVLSTLFFKVFGIQNWHILCYLWTILPLFTLVYFFFVPINQLGAHTENADGNAQSADGSHEGVTIGKLMKVGIFWVFMALMMCSGAAELSMSQWSSFFAETELGVSKQTADILGPCMFAVTMGIARVLFAGLGRKIDIRAALVLSSVLCVASYLLAAYSPYPILALAGCTLCGFSVGILWPGVLSLSAKTYPAGGTAMFAILALAGDAGCFIGPEAVASASTLLSADGTQSVKTGLSIAIVFPAFILISAAILYIRRKRPVNKTSA